MVAWLALALAVLADLLLVCLALGVLWAARKAKPYMSMFGPKP